MGNIWAGLTKNKKPNFKQWLIDSIIEILRREEIIMSTLAEANQKIDSLEVRLTNIAGDVQSQKDEIQQLKDQIAAGTPVSQEQLDALNARLDGILTQATGIDDSVPGATSSP